MECCVEIFHWKKCEWFCISLLNQINIIGDLIYANRNRTNYFCAIDVSDFRNLKLSKLYFIQICNDISVRSLWNFLRIPHIYRNDLCRLCRRKLADRSDFLAEVNLFKFPRGVELMVLIERSGGWGWRGARNGSSALLATHLCYMDGRWVITPLRIFPSLLTANDEHWPLA